MTNAEAIGILALVVETAKGRCFVTDEAISDAYNMAINALKAQGLSKNSPKLDKENGDLQPTCNQLAKGTNVPCKDTISRAAAIDILDAFEVKIENGEPFAYSWARMRITELHSAQPERKKGKWIPQDHNKSNGMVSTLVFYYTKCSECGYSGNYGMNYCPNCGADMREDENDEHER